MKKEFDSKFKGFPIDVVPELTKHLKEKPIDEAHLEWLRELFDRLRGNSPGKLISMAKNERTKVYLEPHPEEESLIHVIYKKKGVNREKFIKKAVFFTPTEKKIFLDLYEKGCMNRFESRILPVDFYPGLSTTVSRIRTKLEDPQALPIDIIRGVGYVFHVLGKEQADEFREEFNIPFKPVLQI